VAGESDTTVQVGGNPPGLDADVIDFDSKDDIAILRVAGLNEPVLHLVGKPRAGTPAAILGYPLDGGYDVEPGRIGQTETVSTEDAYGNGPVLRSITALRGHVRPGNSGGPMVDRNGQVVATVFAAITGSPSGDGGFAVPNALVRQQLIAARHQVHSVPTGACAG
jgi:S1-C subfamily serine protease